jgi:Tol biopolymer transport system component
VLVAIIGLVVVVWPGAASPGQTERVSVDSAGNQANGESGRAAISADGRYVAFVSWASNLVDGDTNGVSDVFVRDRSEGKTERISTASDGTEANDYSGSMDFIWTAMSNDGRYVAFNSAASNLVAGDTNGREDIFVRDLETGETSLVSLDESGQQFPSHTFLSDISGDGRFVLFDTTGDDRLLLRDLSAGSTEFIADYNGLGTVSGDGRYVAFPSRNASLVPNDTNNKQDIFVFDRQSHAFERVSVDSTGNEANEDSHWPSLSDDGRYVAFTSGASNLIPGDDNGQGDVFVRDRQTGVTTLVSVGENGKPSGGDLPAISADGRHVAFSLFPQMFVHHLDTRIIEKVTVNSFGEEANGDTPRGIFAPQAISADGRYVAFDSLATNLSPDDTNGESDIFVHDREAPTLTLSPTPTQPASPPPPGDLPAGGGPPPADASSHTELLLLGGLIVLGTGILAWLLARRRSQHSL